MIEQLPYIGASGGAAAAVLVELWARHRVVEQDEARVGVWAEVGRAADERDETSRAKRAMKFVGAAAVVPALVGAGGFVETTFWDDTEAPAPMVSVIADHTAVVDLAPDGTIKLINRMATAFDQDVSGSIIVAGNNEQTPMSADAVAEDVPGGDADFDNALDLARSQIQERRSKSGDGKDEEAGVLLVTYGHAPGDVARQIADAKTAGIKVSVANIGNSDDKTQEGLLRQLAKETKGVYKEVTDKNVDDVRDEVAKTASEAGQDNGGNTNWPLRVFSMVTALGTLVSYARNRKDQPLRLRRKKGDN